MAIYSHGDLPGTGIPIVDFKVDNTQDWRTTITRSGERVINIEDWDMTKIRLTLPTDFYGMDRTAARIRAHRLRHVDGWFDLIMPQDKWMNLPTSQIQLRGDHDAGDRTIKIDAISDFSIEAGTYFTIAGSRKLLHCNQDVSFDASADTEAEMHIYWRLPKDLDDNAVLDFTPFVRVRYDPTGVWSTYTQQGHYQTVTIMLEEALDALEES